MWIFVHMPKCAGKSLRHALERAYGDRLLLDYANPYKKDIRHRFLYARQYLKGFVFARQKPEIVYGHSSFARYRRFIGKEGVRTAMFFREPVDLICSYYFYLKAKYPDRVKGTLAEFARTDEARHFYRAFLGPLEPEQLDFVGLVESYDASLDLFERLSGVALDRERKNITKNKPENYRRYLEERGWLEEVESAMAENREIYDRAKRRHGELIGL